MRERVKMFYENWQTGALEETTPCAVVLKKPLEGCAGISSCTATIFKPCLSASPQAPAHALKDFGYGFEVFPSLING